jgi:hypothetical protein
MDNQAIAADLNEHHIKCLNNEGGWTGVAPLVKTDFSSG